MFRSLYDSDVTTWSPQGRIHQLEYAIEAVKQGSAVVGLRSASHAVLLSVKRAHYKLASHQKKIFKIDNHIGMAISGLASDARVLGNYLRMQAMRARMLYNRPIPVGRLLGTLGDKAQITTQRYGGRPYGVGLLIAGCDETGPHLYEFSPSGNYYDYHAVSIGARSQSAKTYFEKHFEAFDQAQLPDLILHGLRALRDTLQQDTELNTENLSIMIIGKDQKFLLIENEGCQPYLDALAADPGVVRGGRTSAGASRNTESDVNMEETSAEQATPMDTE